MGKTVAGGETDVKAHIVKSLEVPCTERTGGVTVPVVYYKSVHEHLHNTSIHTSEQ